jgi:predicted peptidase
MNISHIIFSAACGVLVATAAAGEPVRTGAGLQEKCTFKRTVRRTVQGGYLLYLPQDYGRDKSVRWPLVLFLHGSGQRGDDLEKVKVHGPPQLVAEGKQFPFILVSPQCPENGWWDNETDRLTALLDEIEKKYRVDKDRIYLTGMSMGGYGTWALAAKQPKRFAAIAPLCGAGNPFHAPMIKDIPMWVFHGDQDGVIPLARSQEMVDAVRAEGGHPKFTIYPGVGHDCWDATYSNPEFWKWLLEQRRM